MVGSRGSGSHDLIHSGTKPEELISFDFQNKVQWSHHLSWSQWELYTHQDSGSRGLIQPMVVESEERVDWAKAQLELIKIVGLENYLSQQIREKA